MAGRPTVGIPGGLRVSDRPLDFGLRADPLRFNDRVANATLIGMEINPNGLCSDQYGRIWAASDSFLVRYTWQGEQLLRADTVLAFQTPDLPQRFSAMLLERSHVLCAVHDFTLMGA